MRSESAVRLGEELAKRGRGSAAELARAIGVTPAAVSCWVRGEGLPKSPNRAAIEREFPCVTATGWDVPAVPRVAATPKPLSDSTAPAA